MSRERHRYVAARPLSEPHLRRLGPRHLAYHQPVRRRSTLGTVFRWMMNVGVGAAIALVITTLGYKAWVDTQANGLMYAVGDRALPSNHVALVFGAGLDVAGQPSAILYDRVATAVDLYNSNKADKLLMTGDNSTTDHNEVEAMRKEAVDLGVPDEDIVLDYAGFSTYDSCYRARDVFNLQQAILVTQHFHLPRALYTCNRIGVKSVGVAADRQSYDTFSNELREYPALLNNLYRFTVNDKPHFLGPQVDVDQKQER
jgi:vancomycin permeability regulator SanA